MTQFKMYNAYTLYHENIWGSGGTFPHILNLGSRQRWVVIFLPQPLSTHWTGDWRGPGAGLDI